MVSRSSFRKLTSLQSAALIKMSSARWAFDFSRWHPTESDLLLATSCVQSEEKERLARFVFRKDFKASLIGRLLMRRYIHTTTNNPYESIRFHRDEKGKPYCDTSEIAFNVSHQGNFAVLAGSAKPTKDFQLGVDVMKLEYTGGKNLEDFFRIMTKHFSQHEWATIRGENTEKQKIAMFCRHWALKESYVKAIGVGITVNLQDISFKIITKRLSTRELVTDTRLFLKGVKQDWRFEEQLLDEEHCVSVAIKCTTETEKGAEPKGLFEILTFDTLMDGAVRLLSEDIDYVRDYAKKLEKN